MEVTFNLYKRYVLGDKLIVVVCEPPYLQKPYRRNLSLPSPDMLHQTDPEVYAPTETCRERACSASKPKQP